MIYVTFVIWIIKYFFRNIYEYINLIKIKNSIIKYLYKRNFIKVNYLIESLINNICNDEIYKDIKLFIKYFHNCEYDYIVKIIYLVIFNYIMI